MYKETLIKISKPILKVETQPSQPEVESETFPTEETEFSQQLQELELDSADIAEPAEIRFASTDSNGWRASDILREIRLDNFEMSYGD